MTVKAKHTQFIDVEIDPVTVLQQMWKTWLHSLAPKQTGFDNVFIQSCTLIGEYGRHPRNEEVTLREATTDELDINLSFLTLIRNAQAQRIQDSKHL